MQKLEFKGMYISITEKKTDHIALFFCKDYKILGPEVSWEIEKKEIFELNKLPENLSKGAKRRIKEFKEGRLKNIGYW